MGDDHGGSFLHNRDGSWVSVGSGRRPRPRVANAFNQRTAVTDILEITRNQ